MREAAELRNDARLDVPSTCRHGAPPDLSKPAEEATRLAGLLSFATSPVDLPTSHRPMWSRSQELAEIIGDVAKRTAWREGARPDPLDESPVARKSSR